MPAVLTVVAALFILAVAALLVAGVDRSTARSYADRQRAELAARAGLEQLRALLKRETANDDFIIIQTAVDGGGEKDRMSVPYLFLVRPSATASGRTFHYTALFSSAGAPPTSSELRIPELLPLVGADPAASARFTALPYQKQIQTVWQYVRNDQDQPVARFAYWVEDLQGRLDPRLAGNLTGEGGSHVRAAYPFPAPGLNPAAAAEDAPSLDQIALYALAPEATNIRQGTLGRQLIDNRRLVCSPDSVLAAARIQPPVQRDSVSGRLVDPVARAIEENLIGSLCAYDERPLVPCVPGLDWAVIGLPRLNLNRLLKEPADEAVAELADWIEAGMPGFSQRKGGFPDDYIKTLAANVIDYADADCEPTLKTGQYRGVDTYPLMSEIALQVNYLGITTEAERKIMTFRFKLFAELCNPTDQPASGKARLSYEVALPMDGIGSGVGGEPFDSPALLADPQVATHDLSLLDGRYWTREVDVSLQPNQYRAYEFADVIYHLDVGAATDEIPPETPFSLNESKGASGLSLRWNGVEVERINSILRQAGLIYSIKNGVVTGGFKVGTADTLTKAALPGHVYDDYPTMYYNTGDVRMTHYLRGTQLDENAYPENASPNRRNVRLQIYQNDAATKPKVYARVLPSEWPDGGHNAATGSWSPGSSDKVEMTDPKFDFAYDPQMLGSAPQHISNRGRFFSATELGRIFDPIMHAPVFGDSEETNSFRSTGRLPEARTSWPDVVSSQASAFYGGGNTLRIGRPEHPAFDRDGMRAVSLLDMVHAGRSRSDDPAQREGPLIRIEGHVNLNTATFEVLRTMAAGLLAADPLLGKRSADAHLGAPTMAPPVMAQPLGVASDEVEGDRIAAAIIAARPIASAAGVASVCQPDGTAVFGNRDGYAEGGKIEWTDAAAEEVFARVYESATVRSRNFRVWIIAQALAPARTAGAPQAVLADVRKVYTLFADPGTRAADGSIVAGNCNPTVTSRNDF